jgi:glucokinase
LSLLHCSLAEIRGEALGASAQSWSAKVIVDEAAARPDGAAGQTIDVFCAWLGSYCGSVALTLGARQGLYIGGGIVPRLGDRFFASAFRERFEAKGRFASYLADIPTPVITDTMAALTGAACAL